MFAGILAFIQTFLSGLPIVGNFLSGSFGTIVGKFFDAKTAIETARYGGAKDVAVAAIQARVAGLSVIAGSTALTVLVFVFALPLAGFLWKVVMWDIVIGSFQGCTGHPATWPGCATFTTDPIKGEVQGWATTIIACLFGSLTGLGVASVFRKGG